MQFLFKLCNHSQMGARSLEDVIGIIGQQMRALGHYAVHDPKVDNLFKEGGNVFLAEESGYNVLVEGFTDPVIGLMAEMHAKGARFIILATEEPTSKGFNHGTQREMVFRQEQFPKAAKYAEGILYLVPGQYVHDWYSQHAPSAYVELGYAPRLLRAQSGVEPRYDFGFYGSLSKRRHRILKHLAKMTAHKDAVRVVNDFSDQVSRDSAMQECKVVLQIRKFDEMGLVSSSRCNTALCLGRPVVAEPHDTSLSKPWDEIVKFTRSMDEFYLTALAARGVWRAMHSQQFDQFRARLTPEYCIGRALAEIGVLGRKEAA